MPTTPETNLRLRLGARGSLLSRMQSQKVADMLETAHDGLHVELTIIKTTGDIIQDRPLAEAGGKGLFTKELERALLDEQIDFAVHSFKDVPVTMPLVEQDDLVIAAVPRREDPRDVLASTKGRTLAELPQGAKVGTGSPRRRCQVLARRPDLKVELIRGNVDTRIRKLKSGEFDAVVLAFAGLRRSGLYDDTIMSPLEVEELLPSAGQGALAVQCRLRDARVRDLLGVLNHPVTEQCVQLERQVVFALNGDCHSPIAALATIDGERIRLRAAVGARGGEPPILHAQAEAPRERGNQALAQVIRWLAGQGAEKLLGTTLNMPIPVEE